MMLSAEFPASTFADDERGLHCFLSKLLLALSLPTFAYLWIIPAPYGKHAATTGGDGQNNNGSSLSKRVMNSFGVNARVAWAAFEIPNLVWSIHCIHGGREFLLGMQKDQQLFAMSPGVEVASASQGRAPATSFADKQRYVNMFLLSLFVLHYVNRAIVYPLRMNRGGKPVPLFVVLSAAAFTSLNGYLQAQDLCKFRVYPDGYQCRFNFVFGVALFFCGFAINVQSDAILRRLRKGGADGEKRPGSGYKIPRGGFFELVTGANYLGELVEWAGYAVACRSLASLAFFLYTCSNLVPRAVSHHRWYLAKFEDYPRTRWAILPFVL